VQFSLCGSRRTPLRVDLGQSIPPPYRPVGRVADAGNSLMPKRAVISLSRRRALKWPWWGRLSRSHNDKRDCPARVRRSAGRHCPGRARTAREQLINHRASARTDHRRGRFPMASCASSWDGRARTIAADQDHGSRPPRAWRINPDLTVSSSVVSVFALDRCLPSARTEQCKASVENLRSSTDDARAPARSPKWGGQP
jgi:hypothetical protein